MTTSIITARGTMDAAYGGAAEVGSDGLTLQQRESIARSYGDRFTPKPDDQNAFAEWLKRKRAA